jgi:hypothetical protein
MNTKTDWDAFKDGWASGSMECPTCGRIFRDVRFRFSCHDKVEGDWPMCCGVVARYCYDWKPEKELTMDQRQLDDQINKPAPAERLPQRFTWRDDGGWHFGVCIPMVAVNVEYWQIIAGKGHGTFDSNPWESMGHVIGDGEFRWIDNDFNWEPRKPPQENPPTRILHEMADADNIGAMFRWVWTEKVATHEQSGWIQTGRTRVMLSNIH